MLLSMELEEEMREDSDDEVIILSDNLQEALEVGSKELNTDIAGLDYEIMEKGHPGIFGWGRIPYKIHIRRMVEDNRWKDLDDLHVSLDYGSSSGSYDENAKIAINGDAKIRIYKQGVFLKILNPRGDGKKIPVERVMEKIIRAGVLNYEKSIVEKEVKHPSENYIKIGPWVPKPEADSTLAVEVSPDEMKAFITISSPRPGGKHLTFKDIKAALNASNVVDEIMEEDIEDALENEKYSQTIVAASGIRPQNGSDGFIDYKVRIDKTIEFKEDERTGKVDFLKKDLVENVVQGQILAELMPAEKGVEGHTVTGKIMPAKDGAPTTLKPGKGTLVSEDGKTLQAEINGQVVFIAGKINVEEVYTVGGDVGLETGNLMFIGSINIRGSVDDNMNVKAAGNITVGGNVQKSLIEAEGDIIVKQGILGRDGAHIESTSGSLFAKFIQNATISVDKDVVVEEAIMHSKIDAGRKVIANGRRAQIVGGEVMVGEEIRVKQLGAQASTPTMIVVGTNPKILQQINSLSEIEKDAVTKLQKVEKNIKTLYQQKETQPETFNSEKEEILAKQLSFQDTITERVQDVQNEKLQLSEYLEVLSAGGKVHVEKTLFPGVTIEINGAKFEVKDEYNHVTLMEENGNIKIVPYQEDANEVKDWRKSRRKR